VLHLRSIVASLLGASTFKRRLLSGSAWAFGGKVAGAAVGIVTNGLLARTLPPQELGAYFLAISIVSLGTTVGSLGLSKPAVRFVAESMGLGRPGRARWAVYAVLSLGALGALGTGLSYLLVIGEFVGRHLFDSPALVAITGLLAGWMALAVVQELTAETFRGFYDFRLTALLGGMTSGKSSALIMRGLLLACVVLLLVREGETDLKTVVLVSIGSGSVSVLLSVWLLRGRLASLGPRDAASPIGPGEALRVSLPILAIDLTVFLVSSSDVWILGALGSQQEVAIYGAAARLVALVAMPLVMANLVLPPIIAELYAQGNTDKLETTVRTYSTLAGVPSLVILTVLILLGGPILGLVYGDYYQKATTVLVILSVAKIAAVWSGSCGLVLQMTDHQTSMLWVSVLTSPLFFGVALLAAQRYGPAGVASAVALTTCLQNLILVLVAKKKTGMWTHVAFSPSLFRKVLSNR
jgi:O-antigen/teichoic acid export membrane protein